VLPVFMDLRGRKAQGYLLHKSFRRDILRGYLENRPFVFIDLAGKRILGGIYPVLNSKHIDTHIYSWVTIPTAMTRATHPRKNRIDPDREESTESAVSFVQTIS